MFPMHRLVAAAALALFPCACGGSSNNNTGSNPGSGTTTPSTNPCTAAGVSEVQAVGSVAGGAPAPDKKTLIDGNPRGRVYEALWLHRQAEEHRQAARTAGGAAQPAQTSPAPVADDVGEIAVLQDEGDLVLKANTFDLRNTGLRFTRSGGAYTLSKIDGTFRSSP